MASEMYDAEGRPVRGTMFDYNDDWWNNLGTFAANELLGVDDFGRLFTDYDRGDITVGDRLKSLGAGLGELGTTALMFVPGANLAAGASKLPKIGNLAARGVTAFAPATRGEKILGRGAVGAGAAATMLPEDSASRQALEAMSLLGEPAYFATKGGKAAWRGFRGKGMPDGGTAAPKSGNVLMRNKGKVALGTAGAIAVPAAGAALYGGSDAPAAAKSYYENQTGYGNGLPSYIGNYYNDVAQLPAEDDGSIIDPILASITDNYAAQRALVEARRDAELKGYGNDQMRTLQEFIDRYEAISQAQAGAVQGEFNSLADRYGADVGAIAADGQRGAAGVNAVYQNAADRTRRRARSAGPAGRNAVSGLTPVSGPIASAPGDMTDRGRTIADYVGAQAEIAARDAGYDAASAREYGAALGNSFEQEAMIAALGAEMNTKTRIQQQRDALQQRYQDMLLQLQLQETSDRGDVERMLAESEVQKQLDEEAKAEAEADAQLTFEEVITNGELLMKFTTDYETLKAQEFGQDWLESRGIRNAEDFIRFAVSPDTWVAPAPEPVAQQPSAFDDFISAGSQSWNPVAAGIDDATRGGLFGGSVSPTLPIPPLYGIGRLIGGIGNLFGGQ